jgi:hypothetical protein
MLARALTKRALTAALLTAITSLPGQAQHSKCSETELALSISPASLREIIADCGATEISLKALIKLNNSELKNVPQLNSVASNQRGVKKRRSVKTTSFMLYFATGETFPTDQSLNDMGTLIHQINRDSKSVVSVKILSTVDSAEADTPLALSIANGRANTIKKYFELAGIHPSDVGIRAVSVNSSPTTQIRSKDRAALVELFIQ